MSWRDTLRDGSFRGAAFLIDAGDHEFGRRAEVHEYPLRASPWTEDLGRLARSFTIDCYVIGDDYMTARDALIRAAETSGPGSLVHPHYGAMSVSLLRGRVRESNDEGGMARFSLEFVEAGENQTPSATIDTPAAAKAAGDAASDQAADSFVERFSIEGEPTFVAAASLSLIDQAAAATDSAADKLSGAGEALYGVKRRVDALRNKALDLARAPLNLAGQVLDLVRSIRALADTPAAALAALKPLTRFGSTVAAVLGATRARDRQRGNQAALIHLVRTAAAIEAVRSAADLDPASYQDAVAVRDDLAERLDQLAEEAADAADDPGYVAVLDLRAAMVADLTARGGSLERLFDYVPPVTLPALVLAHRLYGDATRDGEIVSRNRVRHPGFVPGGVTLEVLTSERSDG